MPRMFERVSDTEFKVIDTTRIEEVINVTKLKEFLDAEIAYLAKVTEDFMDMKRKQEALIADLQDKVDAARQIGVDPVIEPIVEPVAEPPEEVNP